MFLILLKKDLILIGLNLEQLLLAHDQALVLLVFKVIILVPLLQTIFAALGIARVHPAAVVKHRPQQLLSVILLALLLTLLPNLAAHRVKKPNCLILLLGCLFRQNKE
jgi:hypothetical protein